MGIYKICPRCRKEYEVGKECPNGCYKKTKAEANKVYDEAQRKNAELYHSKAWKMLRTVCLNKFDNICLWTFFKTGKIVTATLIHHIVEVEENKLKALDIDNLIPVSDEAHREIHELYKTSKVKVQAKLHSIKKEYLKKYSRG